MKYGPDEGPAQKVSVSMPAGRIAAVKARVGARGFSAYISAAVERQIQRELLQEKEAGTGRPATEISRKVEALAKREGPEASPAGAAE